MKREKIELLGFWQVLGTGSWGCNKSNKGPFRFYGLFKMITPSFLCASLRINSEIYFCLFFAKVCFLCKSNNSMESCILTLKKKKKYFNPNTTQSHTSKEVTRLTHPHHPRDEHLTSSISILTIYFTSISFSVNFSKIPISNSLSTYWVSKLRIVFNMNLHYFL